MSVLFLYPNHPNSNIYATGDKYTPPSKGGNYGFIKLCYGVVGEYKDTSKMTVDEVVDGMTLNEAAELLEISENLND